MVWTGNEDAASIVAHNFYLAMAFYRNPTTPTSVAPTPVNLASSQILKRTFMLLMSYLYNEIMVMHRK